MNIARKLVLAVATPVTVGALVASAFAAPAVAISGDYATSGVAIRKAPDTSSIRHGLGYPGQGATIYCFTTGDNVSGNPYWDRNRNQKTGVTGYSADYYMSWTGTLYHC